MGDILFTIITLSFIVAITPGPLLALIISETLKHGKGNGIKISLAPFLTDLPILFVTIFILSKLQDMNIILGLISLFGAGYLTYLGVESVKTKKIHLQTTSGSKSIMKGIITNFLNPNPYIFYFSIMSPIIVKAMKINFLYGPLSVMIFLGFFVAVMIAITLSVHKGKTFFNSKNYVYTIRSLGVVLILFALSFLRDSLQFLGVIK